MESRAVNCSSSIKITIISRALEFLTITDNDTKQYKCSFCSKLLNGNNSGNLVAHFKGVHKDIYANKNATSAQDIILVQREKLVHSCVELVTINDHSFRLLSQSGFRSALKDKLNEFKLADCALNLSDHHVLEIKQKIRNTAAKIRDEIK